MLDALAVDQVRELSWRQYPARLELHERQQILITGHDALGAAGLGEPENVQVLGIAACIRLDCSWPVDLAVLTKQMHNRRDSCIRELDLLPKAPADLVEQLRTHEDDMCVKTDLEDGLAETTSGERRHDHIGVEQHFHEMALKTSSSVKNPCASAKGRTFLRRERYFSTAT